MGGRRDTPWKALHPVRQDRVKFLVGRAGLAREGGAGRGKPGGQEGVRVKAS